MGFRLELWLLGWDYGTIGGDYGFQARTIKEKQMTISLKAEGGIRIAMAMKIAPYTAIATKITIYCQNPYSPSLNSHGSKLNTKFQPKMSSGRISDHEVHPLCINQCR